MKYRTRTKTTCLDRPEREAVPEVISEVISEAELEALESLVDELAKQKPQEERIRSYMRQVGLAYTSDPIEQLDSVLRALENKTI